MERSEAVVALGSLDANDIVLDHKSVSRRHAVVVNLADEVWLYDLASTHGTLVDGQPVNGRRFLDGVHRITLGACEFELGARADLLI